MVDIVNALLFRNGKVLLAKRSPGRRSYPGKWSFPGGHVEPGEPLEEALKRELQEELAVIPSEISVFAEIKDPNAPDSRPIKYHLFVVTEWGGGEPAVVDEEHTDIVWLPPKEASIMPKLALPECQEILRSLPLSIPDR